MKLYILNLFLSFIFINSFSSIFAAPIPATSSSFFVTQESQFLRSDFGFSINGSKTKWEKALPSDDNPYIVGLFRSESTHNGVQAGLTVRVDQLDQPSSLKRYVKKWVKDYPRFGFDILQTKPIKINGQLGFLMDMINQKTQKQIRQVVFLKDKLAAILTCRDHQKGFSQSLEQCNKLISGFHWN